MSGYLNIADMAQETSQLLMDSKKKILRSQVISHNGSFLSRFGYGTAEMGTINCWGAHYTWLGMLKASHCMAGERFVAKHIINGFFRFL